MATFAYAAINASGLDSSGQISAPDANAAREQLRVRGLLANMLEELSRNDCVEALDSERWHQCCRVAELVDTRPVFDINTNITRRLVPLDYRTDGPVYITRTHFQYVPPANLVGLQMSGGETNAA